jgi:hypothetical protein
MAAKSTTPAKNGWRALHDLLHDEREGARLEVEQPEDAPA